MSAILFVFWRSSSSWVPLSCSVLEFGGRLSSSKDLTSPLQTQPCANRSCLFLRASCAPRSPSPSRTADTRARGTAHKEERREAPRGIGMRDCGMMPWPEGGTPPLSDRLQPSRSLCLLPEQQRGRRRCWGGNRLFCLRMRTMRVWGSREDRQPEEQVG